MRKGVKYPKTREQIEKKFWCFATPLMDDSGCWVWDGYLSPDGYGRFAVPLGGGTSKDGTLASAHRFAYEFFVGPVAEGLELDHLCRNRSCVNPKHLEPVPHYENIMRGTSPSALSAKKTTCPKGHPYDLFEKGARRCRECRLTKQRASWRARGGYLSQKEYRARKRDEKCASL